MSHKLLLNCLKFSLLLNFLLLLQPGYAQAGFADLEEVITRQQKVLGDNVILMVATKDTIVYQKAPKLFSARTQAPIGHASQWLTAALILQLADEGKLSLDDKISSYLPEFAKYGKNYITLRHCLSHFTGIQTDASKAAKLFEKKKFTSLEEEVASYAAKEIQTNPGTEFRYSNIGPAIAARVAEVATKKKFEMLVQQKLLRPLAMRQTTFSTLDGSVVNPAIGARSTANDYIHFLTMLLNKGNYKGVQVLSENAVKELLKVQTATGPLKDAPTAAKGFDYALGAWAPEQNNAKEAVVLTDPSLGGTLPIVDFCRGYAFLLLLKEETDSEKANLYSTVKSMLDEKFPSHCK